MTNKIQCCNAFNHQRKIDFLATHYRLYSCIQLKDLSFVIKFFDHQRWQSGFSRVYSNYCRSCSFKAEIIKIGQSSHKMYSNNIVKFLESTIILNACTKKVRKLIEGTSYPLKCEKQENLKLIEGTTYVVSAVIGRCNNSFFAQFNVAFESLYWSIHAMFNDVESSSSSLLWHSYRSNVISSHQLSCP